jgi:putative nucleotidyltransferase with HDIG domain
MTLELADSRNEVVEAALAKTGDISTLPEVTAKIIELVEDPNSTARDMHELIKTDPALSSRVLKVVNSAFYGLPGQIASVDRAIVLLGLSAVKNIAIAASVSRMFKGQQVGGGFTAKDLWRHSVAVAVAGRLIAHRVGYAGAADEVFLAGLIHDLGILIERQAFPDKLTEVVERCMSGCGKFLDLENEIIGADHQAFGAGLTTKWKFPRTLRAVIGMHHEPERLSDELRTFGDIIRAADVICCDNKIGFHLTTSSDDLTDELLERVGVTREQLPELVEELNEGVEAAESSLGMSA